jgi:asparagine synthase (glutamine-hydrolysing)
MCGILGYVSNSNQKLDVDKFSNNLLKIKHRGPDDSGLYQNDNVLLGSVRLSIQDLSPNGHMPMLSSNGNLIVVFNGEIYNYKSIRNALIQKGYNFISNSDTEVVLNSYDCWGVACLNILEGMFALCIYDKVNSTLFLARDRAGEKPLYYDKNNNYFAFASELKSLLNYRDHYINDAEFINYLKYGYTSPSFSIVDGINKLRPGCYIMYDCKKNILVEERYWNLPKANSIMSSDVDSLVSELDNLLSGSVKKTLIADVPTGVLLSGGLDSSLITAYAAEHTSGRLKTFNITFDGHKKYDESSYAKTVANFFNTEHIMLSGNEINYDLLDYVFNFFDEPIADSSILPTFIVSELTRNHVKVALGGDGGDELFAGYTTYQRALAIEKYNRYVPDLFLRALDFSSDILPVGFHGKNLINQFASSGYSSFFLPKYFNNKLLPCLLNPSKTLPSTVLDRTFEKKVIDPILEFTQFDFENYLVDDILAKVDRASMANSLEIRAPWLDRSIIEFAFSRVQSSFKADYKSLKILPKKLASKKLPQNLDINRKQGFSIPIHNWAQNHWYDSIKNDLLQLPPETFNIQFVLQLLDSLKKGRSNSHLVFALVAFSKWYNKNNVKFS